MWVRNRKEMMVPRAGRRRRRRRGALAPVRLRRVSFAFQCAASLRLLLIVRHGHCRASVHGVLPVPIRIRVGVGGDRARQPLKG